MTQAQLTLFNQETIHDVLDKTQILEAAIRMDERGGGFASCIGRAYLRADNTNAEKLLRTFPDLFIRFAPKPKDDPYA